MPVNMPNFLGLPVQGNPLGQQLANLPNVISKGYENYSSSQLSPFIKPMAQYEADIKRSQAQYAPQMALLEAYMKNQEAALGPAKGFSSLLQNPIVWGTSLVHPEIVKNLISQYTNQLQKSGTGPIESLNIGGKSNISNSNFDNKNLKNQMAEQRHQQVNDILGRPSGKSGFDTGSDYISRLWHGIMNHLTPEEYQNTSEVKPVAPEIEKVIIAKPENYNHGVQKALKRANLETRVSPISGKTVVRNPETGDWHYAK
jgi:hypothetical protein